MLTDLGVPSACAVFALAAALLAIGTGSAAEPRARKAAGAS
ncbi:hypothetical protein [Streptomyces djakartensis]|uniref:MFS transporter n=1 Tax=Streptomyces djakartensis TaxID=68193 RepID=A0ABQ3ADX6_9ACTN|nr:hypothetical protein [Streptomyces djakartensis]GGY48156.1 hypothetical protein GCM10010384_63080 [Streptomyces djakartensis]